MTANTAASGTRTAAAVAAPPCTQRIALLGCPIDPLGREGLLAELTRRVVARRPTIVLFANVHKIVLARKDPALARALAGADFVLPDGQAVVWAARWLGTPVPERLAGSDMIEATLALASENSWRVFFLGTRPKILEKALETVEVRYPGLIVAGSQHGYFSPAETDRVIDAVNAANADVLLVALGSPQKELWLARYGPRLTVPIRQAVGGSFELLAGIRRRAPRWMQRAGLEWFYRMLQDPRHLAGRYLYTNSVFLLLVARALLRRLFSRS